MKKFLKSITLSILILIISLMLFACAPSSINEAKTKMEDCGYTTIYHNDIKKDGVVGMAKFMRIEKGETDIITVYLYDKASTASSLKDKYKKSAGYNESVTVSGKWIIVATEKAKNDFLS